jgi:CRISPR-associated protein Cas1
MRPLDPPHPRDTAARNGERLVVPSIATLTRPGQGPGRLQPMEGGCSHRRCRQRDRRQRDLPEASRLTAARALVAGTIGNGRWLLQSLSRGDGRAMVEQPLRRPGQLQGLARHGASLNQLRGLEGAAAATTDRVLGSLLEADGFGFAVRGRRPPFTSFDALCGFGEGVLWNALLPRLELRGLDPSIGLWEPTTPHGAALVADLIKPLRAFLLDPFHARLIRARQFLPGEHFASSGHGLTLNAGGRRLWLHAWSTTMAEPITLADDTLGPRWQGIDQLVQSYARFVDDHRQPLLIPSLRPRPAANTQQLQLLAPPEAIRSPRLAPR